ncbi:MAG: esterase-like activity of phytase family protein [Proteobacteria bacterium]|nr:esterase-like activity of phytase family protein [Pseudomonadota bacterium]
MTAFALVVGCSNSIQPTLTGRAILPADTFAGGPSSGTHIGQGPFHGQTVPFVGSQPVQGFSAVLDDGNGVYLAMTDNGFGTMENSADFHLRVYRIRPNFKTADGGAGTIEVLGYFELSDPYKNVPFAITNHFTSDRVLTGADFDIESMQRAADGTFWFGDEFGPFLLHTDAQGVLLEPPIELPDFDNSGQFIRAPQNPLHEEASAVRVMNAVRRHAQLHDNTKPPVFSPYHVMLDYDGADPDKHYARGANEQPGLAAAVSNIFSIASIQNAGYPIVTWTVNDKPRMLELLGQGVNGIISDRPDLLLEALSEFDADGNGTGGDYLTAQGLVDSSVFDAQGHRGARNLRPENTLPAMEAALDNLMGTLETDTAVTGDGVPVLNHDPYISVTKCQRTNGQPYDDPAEQVLIKDLTVQKVQSDFVCNKLIRDPPQDNNIDLSPVTKEFRIDPGLADEYVMPTLDQLFDFVDAYVEYYKTGAGASHADAEARWRNAASVRFNIETKLNPRRDSDSLGNVYYNRTVEYRRFTAAVAEVIIRRGLESRADIQSFDFRTLIHAQANYPAIRTVYLFGDFPIYNHQNSDDGTNLQDENGANTPWLAGLTWPYRSTLRLQPFRAGRSGGFEGMALTADGKRLLALLEKPLDGAGNTLLIHEFDLASRQFTGVRYEYPLDSQPGAESPDAHAIGDFIMIDEKRGLVIERDGTQGDLDGYKKVHLIELPQGGGRVDKTELVDLMKIADPDRISAGPQNGVGEGGETFAFPFVTIEDIVLIDPFHIGVLNDNNYPFSVGRHVSQDLPDDTEFIIIELPVRLVF